MKKILIMKYRNIGDVLLVSPLIKNLKHHYPNAKIDIAVNAGTQAMVEDNPNLNNIIVYDREKIKKLPLLKKIYAELKFALDLRSAKYDMVINTTKGDRGAQLALLSGANIKIGYEGSKNILTKNVFTHILPNQGLRHTIETNLDPLRALDLDIIDKKVEIFWKDDQEIETPPKFIHIHPVSRWMFKCIADHTMAAIIDYCELELGYKVILTAAPVPQEIEKMDSILSLTKSTPINMTGKLTLKQTVALNKKATMFIGVDTAIMHISAANDIPVLAFFGPSGADHWGPWDNDLMQSEYTTRRGYRTMGKHRVIQENWECVPCGSDGCNGTKISDCLMKLNLDFIKQNIKDMIDD
jgi:heptosyltransferase-3